MWLLWRTVHVNQVISLAEKKKFHGIVFDFNGVLLWDRHLQIQAWQKFARALRGKEFSEQELDIHMHGRNNDYVFSYLMGRPVQNDELERLIEQKEHTYRNLCLEQSDQFVLSPGANELLDFFLRHHIPRTIATASGRENVDFFISHLGLAQWFHIPSIVFDDGKVPGKPAPEIYLRAAQNIGLEPKNCVVVEDALSGIQSACTAGIGYIIAIAPSHSQSQLRRIKGVDMVVENLGQIPKENLFLQNTRISL
jgi:beta-phosphoglucomutase-like phosphatase (HAD superfamily)